MVSLLDVNALIALLDAGHVHHALVEDWLGRHASLGFATCPLTQNGFVRIVSQPAYARAVPLRTAVDTLAALTRHPAHRFWPDSASLTDAELFDLSRAVGPRQLTDIYLLGLAVLNGGRLITLDAAIPRSAVRGAAASNMLVLGA